jgi:colicin import membrane protein
MGGGVVRPKEFFIYEKIVRSRIKEAWRWFNTNTALITQVAFEIEPDGLVKNVRVVKSSGDGSFDDSVVRAVTKASPLPPPPPSVYEQYFKSVRITFDPRE